MAEFQIREFRVRDVPKMWEIAQLSFADEISLLGLGAAQVLRRDFFIYGLLYASQRFSRKPRFKFFVAEAKGRAVGGTMIEWENDFAYISAVMVHPEFRRRGIGRALVSKTIGEAFRFGAKKAVLHVREDNLPAKNLYLSLGFQPFETRVNLLREASSPPQEKTVPHGFHIIKKHSLGREGSGSVARKPLPQSPGGLRFTQASPRDRPALFVPTESFCPSSERERSWSHGPLPGESFTVEDSSGSRRGQRGGY